MRVMGLGPLSLRARRCHSEETIDEQQQALGGHLGYGSGAE